MKNVDLAQLLNMRAHPRKKITELDLFTIFFEKCFANERRNRQQGYLRA